MDESNPHIVSIFGEALGFPSAEEQAAYLERVCGDDTELRARIAALLQAHRDAGGFLEGHSGRQDIAGTQANAAVEGAGVAVGPYKLLEQIGEGGMGAVYMADQQAPFRRRVALKIIKPGMDTHRVIARFEAERQALALMDHPNIARVLDAGETASGRPYFVMELVKGVPITEYCDQRNLSIPERLELFGLVCQAVQHAHQKGIIHRDIKPSNVLVTLHDGRPVPKVIDFGIAKATGQRLTDKTLFTEFRQLIGTPLYMSPEQAELSGLDIDTRSDIYSLGVLLYELLTGTTPLERERLKEAAYDEVRRIIREEDPPKPSTRASSLEHSQPSLAALRQTEPRKLCHLLQGDLDWIVMKALEKDRTRRYASAAGLAADIQRHLHDQPIEACPPSAVYRFGKFARRNRIALFTAGFVLVALAAGTLVSTWQAIRATQAEGLADARLRTETKARAEEAQQRKAAEDQRREAEKQRESAEANFQKARQAVDEYFTLVSESKLFDVPGLQPLRKELLESALRFYQQSALERTDNPAVLADLAVTHLRLALVYTSLDRNDDSIAAIGRALDEIDQLHRASPRIAEHDRRLAGFWKGMRWSQVATQMPRDPKSALRILARLEATWQQLADEYPSKVAFKVDQGAIDSLLGALSVSMGQTKEGIAFFRKAIAIGEKVVNDCPSVPAYRADLAIVSQLLANTLNVTGDVAEADRLAQRAVQLGEQLVIEEPNVPEHRKNLGQSLSSRGGLLEKSHPEEAEKASRRAIELHEALVIDFPAAFLYHERLHAAQVRLLLWLTAQGRTKEIEQLAEQIQQSLARFDKAAADFSFSSGQLRPLASYHAKLAQQLRAINRPAEAEQEFVKALDAAEKSAADLSSSAKPADIIAAGEAFRDLGRDLRELQPAKAEQAFLFAMRLFENALLHPQAAGDESSNLQYRFLAADTYWYLGQLSARAGRRPEAEKHIRRMVELAGTLPAGFVRDPERRWAVTAWFKTLNGFLQWDGRRDDALAVLRQGVEYFARSSAELPEEATLWQGEAELRFLLGEELQRSGQADAARTEWTKTLELYRHLAEHDPKEPSYRAWVSDTHWKIAAVLRSQGQIDQAIEAGQSAIDENRNLVQAFPDQTDHRANLALLHRGLSDMLRAAGRLAEAGEAFSASCELYKKLDADVPDKPEYRNRLTSNYLSLTATWLSQANYAEAEAVLRKAMQSFDELVAAHPAAPDYRRLHALFQTRLARLLTLTDRSDEANQTLRQAIDSHQEIIEEFPQYGELGLVYLNLAILLTAAGQPELAEAAYHKGVERVGNNSGVLNNFAWRFATAAEVRFHQPRWAVQLAQKATEIAAQKKTTLNTLGVAQYRAGSWQDAITTLQQATAETNGGTSFDFFFLAMAEWHLGNQESAQNWYAKAIDWMDKHQPKNEELVRFRAEAQELLGNKPGGISPPDTPAPSKVATPTGDG